MNDTCTTAVNSPHYPSAVLIKLFWSSSEKANLASLTTLLPTISFNVTCQEGLILG